MEKVLVRICTLAVFATPALFQNTLMAQAPQANTVPFVASNPSLAHNSWSGNPLTLKGTLTSPLFGTDTFTYDWNPGDGTPHCTGTVTNQYNVSCPHTYSGTVGQSFTAVLTITDTTKGLVSPVAANCPLSVTHGACYYTQLFAPPPNLGVEVNNAIDNGLWYLHTFMRHYTTTGGAAAGDWTGVGGNVDTNGAGDNGPNSLECSAFENSGFLPTSIANPYSDDVKLCLSGIFDRLTTIAISSVNDLKFGTFNPDSNNNGIGVEHDGGDVNYQTGMMLDAIVASGTPATTVTSGTTLAAAITAAHVNGSGAGGAYTYKDAVVDMVDDYTYCQAPSFDNGFGVITAGGGWHYTCQEESGDNSVSQWAAIGIIPAIRSASFGATVPTELHTADETWLDVSFTANSPTNGYFGYTSSSPIWGPYADTPSGMVQLAMNGLGRGTTSPGGHKLWDSAETYIRDNFGNLQSAGAGNSLKDYYYGMFSFTKAMLLHDNNDGAHPLGTQNQALTTLVSSDDPGTCSSPVPLSSPGSGAGPCYPAIDWYGAQTSAFGGSDPTDGVARTIIGNQNADGSWFGQNYTGQQNYFQTGISITMLNHTVFKAVPVACFTANPSQVASGGPVILDGGCSVDQNPADTLVTWEWDLDGTGGTNFSLPAGAKCLTASCSKIQYNFTLPAGKSLPFNYPVRLRVVDSASVTADVVGSVVISSPPNPPQANAGGPYNFCPNPAASGALIYKPFLLDGSRSTNPDQGKTDGTPGAPPSTIVSYKWDYSGGSNFTSASGAQVDATTAFDIPADFGRSFPISLQVKNNDNLAFPSAGLAAGLSSVASAQVTIHQPTDEFCTHCIQTLKAQVKAPIPGVSGNVQLYWTDTNTSPQVPIDHYNVYRSTSSTFVPAVQIAGANSGGTPAVAVSKPAGGTVFFQDNGAYAAAAAAKVTVLYYRIAPATNNDTETCQGNVAITVPLPKGR